jgi:N-acetylmuramoyl-L-alanine amidase
MQLFASLKTLLGTIFLLSTFTIYAGPTHYWIDNTHVSPNQDARVRLLVLGTTETKSTQEALDIFMNPSLERSVHYLVSDTPDPQHGDVVAVYLLVPEAECAWSSGVSCAGSRRNVNPSAIGVWSQHQSFETGTGALKKTAKPWPDKQVAALAELANNIIAGANISPRWVWSYSEVTAMRDDFAQVILPWEKLHEEYGIGAWPKEEDVQRYQADEVLMRMDTRDDIQRLQKELRKWGYTGVTINGEMDKMTKNAIIAFQLHYRQSNFDGVPDPETIAILYSLLEQHPNQ